LKGRTNPIGQVIPQGIGFNRKRE